MGIQHIQKEVGRRDQGIMSLRCVEIIMMSVLQLSTKYWYFDKKLRPKVNYKSGADLENFKDRLTTPTSYKNHVIVIVSISSFWSSPIFTSP